MSGGPNVALSPALLVDLAIGFTLLEALVLAWLHRRTGRGLGPRQFVPNLAADLALMLGLRAAAGDAALPWVAAALVASGLAHALDLARRWGTPR